MEAVMEIQRTSAIRSARTHSFSANQPKMAAPLSENELKFYQAVFNEEVASVDRQIARLKKYQK